MVEALRRIANGSRRNKTARLREIFDEVEDAKARGASNKTIVDGLAEGGLIFDVNNFKNARSRILKERAMEALAQAASAHHTEAVSSKPKGPRKIANTPESSLLLPMQEQGKSEETQVNPKPLGSRRPSILSTEKLKYGELNPSPVNGMVDLNQTTKGTENGN